MLSPGTLSVSGTVTPAVTGSYTWQGVTETAGVKYSRWTKSGYTIRLRHGTWVSAIMDTAEAHTYHSKTGLPFVGSYAAVEGTGTAVVTSTP